MSDKRSVHTDALETLGTIIDDTAARDAIHLAVEPCIAAQRLHPGERIGLDPHRRGTPHVEKILGIVDPFLTEDVQPGQKFWLVVLPRTITSLRHVWAHPDFMHPADVAEDNLHDEAKTWIEQFAINVINTDYNTLMNGADEYAAGGDYLHMGDNEAYSDATADQLEHFWKYWEILRGRSPKNTGSFFSCSC